MASTKYLTFYITQQETGYIVAVQKSIRQSKHIQKASDMEADE